MYLHMVAYDVITTVLSFSNLGWSEILTLKKLFLNGKLTCMMFGDSSYTKVRWLLYTFPIGGYKILQNYYLIRWCTEILDTYLHLIHTNLIVFFTH